MNQTMQDYLVAQIPKRSAFFAEMEEFAKENHVPIMEADSLHAMLQIMAIQKPKRILELGTAIGYSALRMHEVMPDVEIVTIERDEWRYQLALKNVERYGARKIDCVLGDALIDADKLLEKGPYDAIFIDAAKAQYEKFFALYTPVLNQSGVLYSDNVLFKGLALDETDEVKKKARVARKMRDFNQFLVQQENFVTTTIPLGDGLAITRRSEIS